MVWGVDWSGAGPVAVVWSRWFGACLGSCSPLLSLTSSHCPSRPSRLEAISPSRPPRLEVLPIAPFMPGSRLPHVRPTPSRLAVFANLGSRLPCPLHTESPFVYAKSPFVIRQVRTAELDAYGLCRFSLFVLRTTEFDACGLSVFVSRTSECDVCGLPCSHVTFFFLQVHAAGQHGDASSKAMTDTFIEHHVMIKKQLDKVRKDQQF